VSGCDTQGTRYSLGWEVRSLLQCLQKYLLSFNLERSVTGEAGREKVKFRQEGYRLITELEGVVVNVTLGAFFVCEVHPGGRKVFVVEVDDKFCVGCDVHYISALVCVLVSCGG